jgi:hypothetical protein
LLHAWCQHQWTTLVLLGLDSPNSTRMQDRTSLLRASEAAQSQSPPSRVASTRVKAVSSRVPTLPSTHSNIPDQHSSAARTTFASAPRQRRHTTTPATSIYSYEDRDGLRRRGWLQRLLVFCGAGGLAVASRAGRRRGSDARGVQPRRHQALS